MENGVPIVPSDMEVISAAERIEEEESLLLAMAGRQEERRLAIVVPYGGEIRALRRRHALADAQVSQRGRKV